MPWRSARLDDPVERAGAAQRRGVDREPAVVVREVAHRDAPDVSLRRRAARAAGACAWPRARAARAGPRRRRAGTPRRSGASERALCWPPTIVKWRWWPFSQARKTIAGLVEARRRLEDVARERHGRREDRVEARDVAFRERAERGARRRRDRVEDAEQRVAVLLVGRAAGAVAGDQLGVVEVVAGVHANAFGKAAPHRDLLVLVEQRDLDAVDLARIGGDDAERDVHRPVDGVAVVRLAAEPVAGELRVEHRRRASAGSPAGATASARGRRRARSRQGSWRRARARGSPSR